MAVMQAGRQSTSRVRVLFCDGVCGQDGTRGLTRIQGITGLIKIAIALQF